MEREAASDLAVELMRTFATRTGPRRVYLDFAAPRAAA
jgi:hypothetical protein